MFFLDLPLQYQIAAVLVTLIGSARLTRVIVHDDFPPSMWFRVKFVQLVGGETSPWAKLALCHWCLSFWVTLAAIGSFFLCALSVISAFAWWIFWGGLAISYLAAILVHHDEGAE